tara:strand:+ start:11398 stop:12177 length:780 start_codon:yes stop_codon:yes gene_type:complete
MTLRRAWEIQRRVIFALLMREVLTRFGRHNIGFLWMFAEPMMFTLGITALWTASGAHQSSDLPITVFALTGYSSVLLWRNMPARAISSIQPNLALMYHRNVKLFDIFFARLLLEAVGATMSFFMLSLIFIYIGWVDPPEDVLKVIAGWILLTWFGMALAIFLGALSEHSELVEKFWHPTAYFLFPLSGAGFLLEILPEKARELLLYIPMLNCVEYVRDGYFGSHFHAYYSVSYVIVFNCVLSLLALAKLREVSRTVIPK